MIALLILVVWWVLLVAFAWALCRSGANADRWARERGEARDALAAMGDEVDMVEFDYLGGWRHRA